MGIMDSLTGALGMDVKPSKIRSVKSPSFLRGEDFRGNVGTGMGTLGSILEAQGRTDPRLFNRELVSIRRGGEALQGAAGARAARLGTENSGLAAAIDAAIGSSTENRVGDAYAREAQITEQRKRQDIMNLLMPLLGMKMGWKQMKQGVAGQQAGLDMQAGMANAQTIKDLLSAAMAAYGAG